MSYEGHDELIAMRSAPRYNAHLLRLVEMAMGARTRIVDIGAGLGDFAVTLSTQGREVRCVEPDGSQREQLERRGLLSVDRASSLAPRWAQGAYALNVLEHIEDDAGAVREWAQILEPGGRLLVYVPAFQHLYSAMDARVGHYRRYTRRRLVRTLNGSGLRVLHSDYADPLGYFAAWALKCRGGSGRLSAQDIALYDRWGFPLSQALDAFTLGLFGKNTWAIAEKPKLALTTLHLAKPLLSGLNSTAP
jgi:SAM-dependent methyltransferase